MFVGGDDMLPDYEIKIQKQPDKRIIILEFILILLIFQSAIFLLTSNQKEEAIQFRILAHSNTVKDQLEKEKVQQEIGPLIQQVIEETKTPDEFVDNLKEIEPLIIKRAEAIAPGKKITFKRDNVAIPPKRSGFFVQPQANYHAYLLTIGSGRGDNWWCALFQNICFPENEEKEEETVTFFIWEWIKDLFS